MPAVKAARPTAIFAPEDWARLTQVSRWRGLALVVHAWVIVALVAGGTAWAWQANWLVGLAATPLALMLLGGRQLGLAILMHEAAHGLTHPKRRINNWVGDWLAGAATGADLQSYRAYHLTHHRYTQQPEDPDLSLSAPFPVSPQSLRRKVLRDLTGQTFAKQRAAQFGYALKGLRALLRGGATQQDSAAKRDTSAGTTFNRSSRIEAETGSRNGVSAPVTDDKGAIAMARSVGRFLAVQIVLLAVSLLTFGVLPYLLWLAALATTFPLFLRIRNIAEHACTTTGSDDPFSHARTTYANGPERWTVAPYWVNYHAEHHLFMAVPCYHLAEAHELLMQNGYTKTMMIAPGYRAVLEQVTGRSVKDRVAA